MTDWQQRVVDEQRDLDEKLAKLERFLTGVECGRLDEVDRSYLRIQCHLMRAYSRILGLRIERF